MSLKNWIFVILLILVINPVYAVSCDPSEINQYCREKYPLTLSNADKFYSCTGNLLAGCQEEQQYTAYFLLIVGFLIMTGIIIGVMLLNKRRKKKK